LTWLRSYETVAKQPEHPAIGDVVPPAENHCEWKARHEKDGELNLNWQSLIQPRQTVVLYIGLSSLAAITGGFINHGADPATPAAIIENGTRACQDAVFNIGCAVGAVQTLPPGTWIAMNGCIWDPKKVPKNRSKNCFEAL